MSIFLRVLMYYVSGQKAAKDNDNSLCCFGSLFGSLSSICKEGFSCLALGFFCQISYGSWGSTVILCGMTSFKRYVHKYTYTCVHTCPHMHILTQTHTFTLTHIICISRKLIKEYISYSPSKHPQYFLNSFLLLYCPPLTSQVVLLL